MSSFESSYFFAVNVLAAGQRDLSRHFATRQLDKFGSIAFAEGLGGCPLVEGTIARFECRKEHEVVGGDHIIFIGRVERATCRHDQPLIFSAGQYGTHALLDEVEP